MPKMQALVPVAFGLALLSTAVTAAPTNQCCDLLAANLLAGQVIATAQKEFTTVKAKYFSALSSDATPSCFVFPRDAPDVSKIIKILSSPERRGLFGCNFAIKSGGYDASPNLANIQGGITIDLSRLNTIDVSPDHSYVSVGAGNRWSDVYSKLETLELAVSGGRWGNVGVGGLLTGGGHSFFQGREGPACDGVIKHEVVLADGSIVEADSETLPDLHRALKGGNNNFGIVTRFVLKAFPQGQVWGGNVVVKNMDQTLAWFEEFASSSTAQADPNGMVMLTFGRVLGSWSIGGLVTYSQRVRNPPIFQRLYNNSASSTISMTTYGKIARDNAAATSVGSRVLWATVSHVNSADFMRVVLDLAAQTNAAMPYLSSLGLVFEPLWASSRANSFANGGGNALGLDEYNDDVVVVIFAFTYVGATYDARIRTAAKNLVENVQARAQQMRVYIPYLSANYAADFQDPMAGYGAKNKEIMIAIAQKYDPNQFFQKQLPGGFKLIPPPLNKGSPWPTNLPETPYQANPFPQPVTSPPAGFQPLPPVGGPPFVQPPSKGPPMSRSTSTITISRPPRPATYTSFPNPSGNPYPQQRPPPQQFTPPKPAPQQFPPNRAGSAPPPRPAPLSQGLESAGQWE